MTGDPTPEVSVIFPVYNVREYVANSLGTIQDQSFENIEIICVIDGATDDSAAIIQSTFADPRIRIVHQENKGLGGARNTGIGLARAPWITFVDSDDWLHPRYVEALLTKAREGYDIVDCVHNVIDRSGLVKERRTHLIENFDRDSYFRQVISAQIPSNACARLYRRELFDGITFPEHTVHEDLYVVWRLYQRATTAITLREPLYNWLWRGDSLSRSVSRQHIDDIFRCFDDTESRLAAHGQLEATLDQHYRRCYHFASGLAGRISGMRVNAPIQHAQLQRYLTEAVERSRHFNSKSLARTLERDPGLVRALDAVVDLDTATKLGCLAETAGFTSRRVPRPVAIDPIYTISFAGLLLMVYRKLRPILAQRLRR